jgi:hypothetical protein
MSYSYCLQLTCSYSLYIHKPLFLVMVHPSVLNISSTSFIPENGPEGVETCSL